MEQVTYFLELAKRPNEKRPITCDFTGRLPTGATISSCSVLGKNRFTGNTDNTIISGLSGTVSGSTVSIYAQAGTAGQQYEIWFTVTLSDSSVLVEVAQLSVYA